MGVSLTEFGKAVFGDALGLLDMVAEICSNPIADPNDPGEFSSILPAFYHCTIIAVARLFTDPLWGSLGKPPAADEMPHLESHALTTLTIIERRLAFVGGECLFHLPLMSAIALEIHNPDDKRRFMMVLASIARKGFVLARTYMSDFQLAWSLNSSQSTVAGQENTT